MTTVLQYLVIAAVIGLVIFGIAIFVFGRGEQLAPLSPRVSPTELPDADMTADDVRKVRFSMALRGYRMSDVDWALERMAGELDRLRTRIADLSGSALGPETDNTEARQNTGFTEVLTGVAARRSNSGSAPTAADGANLRSADPGSADPGSADPGSADPGSDNPGGVNPGGANPGSANPASVNPGSVNPGSAQAGGGTHPGSAHPSSAHPSSGERS